MKTDKRKKGSFLSIIIRNYLWFSFAVLLALMSIVVVINWMGEQHFSGLKTKKIKKFTEYLEEGNYEKFPSDILLGQKGAFVILDENLRMIYQSKSDMPKRFTEEELFFVNELDKKEKIKAVFYHGGKERIPMVFIGEVVREESLEDGRIVVGCKSLRKPFGIEKFIAEKQRDELRRKNNE